MLRTKRPALRLIAQKIPLASPPVRSRALERALAAVSELCSCVGDPAGIDLDVYLESIEAGLPESQALARAREERDVPLAANADLPVAR